MNLPFQPPPGLTNNDSVFAAPGRWSNGSLARFTEGGWQVKGGWERLTLENLEGVCRSVLGYQDQSSQQNIAFGLHNGLKVWRDALVWDITPQVTVTGAQVGTFNASTTCNVYEPGHARAIGELVTISGAPVPTGGVNLNGTWAVTEITDANDWHFDSGQVATSGAATAPGVITLTSDIPPGMIDGTGGRGFGTGAYGVGEYGEPSNVDYFPRTWALATFGGFLVANPRGGPIYFWDQVTPGRATVVPGAPAEVAFTVVPPQRQIMALGCNEEVSGVFNPLCIRWSDIEDYTDWTSSSANNAGEWILESGGRIVCGRVIGDYVAVWTSDGLFLGTFLGDPGQTWKFERQGAQCGSISPGAPIIRGQRAAWITPDRVFYNYTLGGEPQPFGCDIHAMFQDHVSQGQDDKIVGSSVALFQELTWFWPDDRDGLEISRALSVSTDGWSRDLLARSAFCDAGPQVYPVGVSPSGNVYWHEKGNSADGGILAGFLESSDFYLAEAEGGVLVNGVWPDFKNQIGPLKLTIYVRENPQSSPRAHGPWTLSAGQGRKSFRLSGRIARVRWDFGSAPCFARGGKPEFDIAPIGGR